jgi:hypothetical protein
MFCGGSASKGTVQVFSKFLIPGVLSREHNYLENALFIEQDKNTK